LDDVDGCFIEITDGDKSADIIHSPFLTSTVRRLYPSANTRLVWSLTLTSLTGARKLALALGG
jgi:hypothetical protein